MMNTIKNWDDLQRIRETFSSGKWLFRGQEDCFPLVPSIGRVRADGDLLKRTLEDERRMLEAFKRDAPQYTRRLCDMRQPQDDLEWLSTARHHGLPTRLLDWTKQIEVAAFFAIQYCGTTSRVRPVLYAIPRLLDIVGSDPFHITGPCCFETNVGSDRIKAQSSVFTVHPEPTSHSSLRVARYGCFGCQMPIF